MSFESTKQILRRSMQKKIAWLSPQEKTRQSQYVTEHIYEIIESMKMHSIALFVPYPSEPNLLSLVKHIKKKWCVISFPITTWWFVPVANVEDIHIGDTWYANAVHSDMLDYTKIDMIIVPWVAFTSGGKRLWRGAWWYDRVLSLYRQQNVSAFVVGVCFTEQIVTNLPLDSHDQWVDVVLYAKVY